MAAMRVADIYYWGKGVAADHVRTVPAYKMGAEGGHAGCQHQLGMFYLTGQAGVEVDNELAVAWIEKSAAQNNAVAGEFGRWRRSGAHPCEATSSL